MQTWTNPKTDKSSWARGPWDEEPDKAQWVDESTGLALLFAVHPVRYVATLAFLTVMPCLERITPKWRQKSMVG